MEELEVNHVEDIHEKLTSMIGQRVKVRANMGRTRVVERMGTIKTVHPAVFIVEVDAAAVSRVSRTSMSMFSRAPSSCSIPSRASTCLPRWAISSRSTSYAFSFVHRVRARKGQSVLGRVRNER